LRENEERYDTQKIIAHLFCSHHFSLQRKL